MKTGNITLPDGSTHTLEELCALAQSKREADDAEAERKQYVADALSHEFHAEGGGYSFRGLEGPEAKEHFDELYYGDVDDAIQQQVEAQINADKAEAPRRRRRRHVPTAAELAEEEAAAKREAARPKPVFTETFHGAPSGLVADCSGMSQEDVEVYIHNHLDCVETISETIRALVFNGDELSEALWDIIRIRAVEKAAPVNYRALVPLVSMTHGAMAWDFLGLAYGREEVQGK